MRELALSLSFAPAMLDLFMGGDAIDILCVFMNSAFGLPLAPPERWLACLAGLRLLMITGY
jgi:flagellar biosynthesis protein FliP